MPELVDSDSDDETDEEDEDEYDLMAAECEGPIHLPFIPPELSSTSHADVINLNGLLDNIKLLPKPSPPVTSPLSASVSSHVHG